MCIVVRFSFHSSINDHGSIHEKYRSWMGPPPHKNIPSCWYTIINSTTYTSFILKKDKSVPSLRLLSMILILSCLSYETALLLSKFPSWSCLINLNISFLGECDRQFQLKMQEEKRKDDAKWKLLARKVASAKVMSSLSLPKRKRDEEIRGTINNPGIRSFKLLWIL